MLDLHTANERRRYKVTLSLIGWMPTLNKLCYVTHAVQPTTHRAKRHLHDYYFKAIIAIEPYLYSMSFCDVGYQSAYKTLTYLRWTKLPPLS